MSNRIDIYTDGAASTKTGCGGWACIVVQDSNIIKTLQGFEKNTTNNRMELVGFLNALKFAKDCAEESIEIFCDSAYVVNCFNEKWYIKWELNNWKTSNKQAVKNKDLWEEALILFSSVNNNKKLKISKVQSHSENKYNNYADLIAVKERKNIELREGF